MKEYAQADFDKLNQDEDGYTNMHTKIDGIKIEKAGIIEISNGYDTRFSVNDRDIIEMIIEEMEDLKRKPEKDYNGRYAGKITISINFIGDMDE